MVEKIVTKRGDTLGIPFTITWDISSTVRVHLKQTPTAESYFVLEIVNNSIIVPSDISSQCNGLWRCDVEVTTENNITATVASYDITFEPDQTSIYDPTGRLKDIERHGMIAKQFMFRKENGDLEYIPRAGDIASVVILAEQVKQDAQQVAEDKISFSESEQLRISNETERINAEGDNTKGRVKAENDRQSNETNRGNAEATRGTNETARQNQESTRQTNETNRGNAETTRATNETTRQNQETTRQSQEGTRQTQEADRVLAEAGRVAGGAVIQTQIKQVTGNSTTNLISQKAAADNYSTKKEVSDVNTGASHIFENVVNLTANTEATIPGINFTPPITLRPVSVSVLLSGVSKAITYSYVANGSCYDIKLTSTVDLVGADVAVLGTAQNPIVYPKSAEIVLFGDSITDGNSDGPGENLYNGTLPHNQNYASGFFNYAQIFLYHKFKMVYNAGKSNDTTTQMAARLQTDVIAKNPSHCMVLGGVNDIANNNSASSVLIANLTTIYDAILNAGIHLICAQILPCNSITTAGNKTALAETNAWIANYAATHYNVTYIDWYEVIKDPATNNNILAAYSADGTHPNPSGGSRLGQYLYSRISSLTPNLRLFNERSTDANVLLNGFLTGNSSGKATGWSSGGTTATVVFSKVARTDGVLGEWQQFAVTGAGNVAFFQTTAAGSLGTLFNVGDTIYAQLEFEMDDPVTGMIKFELNTDMINNSSTNLGTIGSNVWQLGAADLRVPKGSLRTPALQVPTGVTKLVFQFKATFAGTTAATIRISRCEIRKVV